MPRKILLNCAWFVLLGLWWVDSRYVHYTSNLSLLLMSTLVVFFAYVPSLTELFSSRPRKKFILPSWSFFLFLYSIWFIYRTSFSLNGSRYYCLFDDAMISMTYAKNVVNGFGLNWAKFGHPVEGFTSPLWVFTMALVHFVGLPDKINSLVIQLVSSIFLVMNLWLIRRILLLHFDSDFDDATMIWQPAVFLTVTCHSLNMWALLGMESGVQATLVLAAVYLTMEIVHGSRVRPIVLGVILGLSLLLRMDMIFMVLICLFYLWKTRKSVYLGDRSMILIIALAFAPITLYQVFRIIYFGDILPNTYYLKLTGVNVVIRILRGWDVTLPYVLPLLPFWGLSLYFLAHDLRKLRDMLFISFIAIVYFSYSIYVGGDAWEWSAVGGNRFTNFVMPLVFVVFNAGLTECLKLRHSHQGGSKNWRQDVARMITLVFFLTLGGYWLDDFAGEKSKNIAVINLPPHVNDHKLLVAKTLLVNEIVDDDAVVAVGWAGIPAYFGRYRLLDMHGYNNRFIAKEDSNHEFNFINYSKYLPGHEKWDPEYIYKTARPDLIFQAADPVIAKDSGYENLNGWWVRGDSTLIKRDKMRQPEFGYYDASGREPYGMAGVSWIEPITGMKFSYVPEGCFMMGGAGRSQRIWPQHEVCLDGFWIGTYEVTQKQWKRIMGTNPSSFKKGSDYPVESITWNDVQLFLEKMNQYAVGSYRLPTEAEWEYACRGGGRGENFCGGNDPYQVAWFVELWQWGHHPVGQKRGNFLGIYDMSGNVTEWVADYFGEYPLQPQKNPHGPLRGSYRSIRGGAWDNTADEIRSTMREWAKPDWSRFNLGFRIVMNTEICDRVRKKFHIFEATEFNSKRPENL